MLAWPIPARSQESLANQWLHMMPQQALDIVRNQRLAPGGDLVKLEFEYGRPSAKDMPTNMLHHQNNYLRLKVLSVDDTDAVACLLQQSTRRYLPTFAGSNRCAKSTPSRRPYCFMTICFQVVPTCLDGFIWMVLIRIPFYEHPM